MKQLLSLATSAGTLFGMWAVGRKFWWGWLVGILNQGVWFAFIVAFAAWGLLPLSGALLVLYSVNLSRWRRQR